MYQNQEMLEVKDKIAKYIEKLMTDYKSKMKKLEVTKKIALFLQKAFQKPKIMIAK